MKFPEGKAAWIVKIGERGQFVIPKEAREMFHLNPGDSILVLADEERGLAIPTQEVRNRSFALLFDEMSQKERKD